jgi:hypothetical protein
VDYETRLQPTTVDAYDVDGDGAVEMVVGTTDGTRLHIYDYFSMRKEWQSDLLSAAGNGVIDVAFANLDVDAATEIIVLVENDWAYIFNTSSSSPKAQFSGRFTAMDVKYGSVFLADASGYLRRYVPNGTSYQQVLVTRLHTEPVTGLNIKSLSPLVVGFSSDGVYREWSAGTTLFESPYYGAPFGNQMVNDVTAGQTAIVSYRLPAPALHSPIIDEGSQLVQLGWTTVMEGASYRLQADTDPEFGSPFDSEWITSRTYSVESVTGRVTYYRVKARSADGLSESKWSRIESFGQGPPPAAAALWMLFD